MWGPALRHFEVHALALTVAYCPRSVPPLSHVGTVPSGAMPVLLLRSTLHVPWWHREPRHPSAVTTKRVLQSKGACCLSSRMALKSRSCSFRHHRPGPAGPLRFATRLANMSFKIAYEVISRLTRRRPMRRRVRVDHLLFSFQK